MEIRVRITIHLVVVVSVVILLATIMLVPEVLKSWEGAVSAVSLSVVLGGLVVFCFELAYGPAVLVIRKK